MNKLKHLIKKLRTARSKMIVSAVLLVLATIFTFVAAFAWFVRGSSTGTVGILSKSFSATTQISVVYNDEQLQNPDKISNLHFLPEEFLAFSLLVSDVENTIVEIDICFRIDISKTDGAVEIQIPKPNEQPGQTTYETKSYRMIDLYTVAIALEGRNHQTDTSYEEFENPIYLSELPSKNFGELKLATIRGKANTQTNKIDFDQFVFKLTFSPPAEIDVENINLLQETFLSFSLQLIAA